MIQPHSMYMIQLIYLHDAFVFLSEDILNFSGSVNTTQFLRGQLLLQGLETTRLGEVNELRVTFG